MKIMNTTELENWYGTNFEKDLKGKRILFEDIEPLLKRLDASKFEKEILGTSEEGTSIYKLKIGSGKKKILIWSQMHGNESTGTKAVFDLFQFLQNPGSLESVKNDILNNCTLVFIPMLNPDGSKKFTRVNSKEIDLNRDAVNRVAKESNLLRSVLDAFNPEFCFNLHDQRTIFNVQGTKNPATISFLAPSEDLERTLTVGRRETMSVIVSMDALLSKIIPNHIGRYTDEFYPTATGDNFQKLGHNTILIEAGHYYDDYDREEVRKFNFFAMLQGMHFIATEDDYTDYKPYFNIPNNDKKCYDIIYRNVKNKEGKIEDVAFQYDYQVMKNELVFVKQEADRGQLTDFVGHKEYDLEKKELKKD
ncbi:M14 family zinc carboxypeptidase [Flavicella sp.]|uniref:M14 family zinc carboxypeptidase n=1 Tax=Flavicella sp. TaxID=2957742 RepID=UPI0026310172|nr:M14 family zinc carboxypeptidase [Flavicella sp.]MDG1805726.1 M14 family zinc carboxypeptidase [Flavicella sp.]